MTLPKESRNWKSGSDFHKTALLKESIKFLKVKKGNIYFDLTVGGGGLSLEILNKGGKVFALDQDPEAVAFAKKRLTSACPSGVLMVVKANFTTLEEQVQRFELPRPTGVLLDLGTSHFQIKKSGRGFTFEGDEPLDMRMDPDLAVTAADLLNALSKRELGELFTKLAEEKRAFQIASRIVRARQEKPIKTTKELSDLVVRVYHGRRGKLHPATKVFQALRIAVNDELTRLEEVLPQALAVLKSQGRLVVISFHGLEDRIVKQFFKEKEQKGELNILTKKPIKPTREEVLENPRARSACLRAAEKI